LVNLFKLEELRLIERSITGPTASKLNQWRTDCPLLQFEAANTNGDSEIVQQSVGSFGLSIGWVQAALVLSMFRMRQSILCARKRSKGPHVLLLLHPCCRFFYRICSGWEKFPFEFWCMAWVSHCVRWCV